MAGESAQGPAVLGGELVDALAGIRSGIHPDGVAGPAVFKRLWGDFFHLLETIERGGGSGRIGLDFHVDAAGGAHLGDEVRRGIGGFDLPAIDDDDAVASHLHFRQDVGGNEDGVGLAEVADEFADLADLVGIEAIGGLVENEQLGIVDEGIRQADALAEAFGEGFDHFAADVAKAAGIDHVGHAAAAIIVVEALELGAEFQVFAHPHLVIERHVFGHVADFSAGFEGLAKDIAAADAGGAGGGWQVAGEHAQGGGFPGTVWPEEADDFAFGYGK